MTKTTKTPATKTTTTKSVKVAKKPAVKAEPAKTTAPAVKTEPAKTTAPAVKAEPAKTTAPAVKAEPAKAITPATKPVTKVEAKVSMRIVKGSSWEDLKDCPMWVNHHDSKSAVGRFIIEFFSNKDFTGEELANAFMNQFKTKTGIKPDEKWARRNVKLFVDKGIIMCEIEEDKAE